MNWKEILLLIPVWLFAGFFMPMVILFNLELPTYNESLFVMGTLAVITIGLSYAVGGLIYLKVKHYL